MSFSVANAVELQVNNNGKVKNVISFPSGLIGMEEYKEFIMEEDPGLHPLIELKSLTEPAIRFVALEPWYILADYEFDLSDSCIADLYIKNRSNVRVINLAVIPEKLEDMTVNLKAPIIINTRNGLSKQIILESKKYSVKHKVAGSNKRTDRG